MKTKQKKQIKGGKKTRMKVEVRHMTFGDHLGQLHKELVLLASAYVPIAESNAMGTVPTLWCLPRDYCVSRLSHES